MALFKCKNCGDEQDAPRAAMPCPKCRGYVERTRSYRGSGFMIGFSHLMPGGCADTVADDLQQMEIGADDDWGGDPYAGF